MNVYVFGLANDSRTKYKYFYVSSEWDSFIVGGIEISAGLELFGIHVIAVDKADVSVLHVRLGKQVFPECSIIGNRFYMNGELVVACVDQIVNVACEFIIPLDGCLCYYLFVASVRGDSDSRLWVLFKYPEMTFCGSYSDDASLQTQETTQIARLLMRGEFEELLQF